MSDRDLDAFDDVDDLIDYCMGIWAQEAPGDVMEQWAQSHHTIRSLGTLDGIDNLTDCLPEFFSEYSQIYFALGEGDRYYSDTFPLFRVLAAAHPGTAVGVLERLALDESPEVLWAVAGNPSSPQALLLTLSQTDAVLPEGLVALADPWPEDSAESGWRDGIRWGTGNPWEVRNVPIAASVAGNRATSTGLLGALAQTSRMDVALALLQRNSDRLTRDHWKSLVEGTRGRDRSSAGWLQWLACSPHLPTEFHAEIVEDPVEREILLRCLAANPLTTPEVLDWALDQNPDTWTRSRIARHPSITGVQLDQLAVDRDARVREAVIASPYSTDEQKALAAVSQ